MTVHLISVGLSLLETLTKNARDTVTDQAMRDRLKAGSPATLLDRFTGPTATDAAGHWLAGALAPAGAVGSAADHAELVALCAAVTPEVWKSSWGAELQTFAHRPSGGHQLGPDDTATLICSDTIAGLCAGFWNAAALVAGDLTRVRYTADPEHLSAVLRGGVTIVRVPGMDVHTEADFVTAMRGLGHLVVALRGQEPVECCLSGGYKAAIPYLIGACEWMRSVAPDRDVQAFVLHETTDRRIPLPLRRISAAVARQELTGWRADGGRDLPLVAERRLDGYAYAADADGCWWLTPFGEGLRVVFGTDDPCL